MALDIEYRWQNVHTGEYYPPLDDPGFSSHMQARMRRRIAKIRLEVQNDEDIRLVPMRRTR